MPGLGRAFIRAAVVAVLLSAAGLLPSFAASFDCSKAATPVERAICQDPQTSKLDEMMVGAYRQALSTSNDPTAVREVQRAWLRHIRNHCESIECLQAAYRGRIADLNEGRVTALRLSPQMSAAEAAIRKAPVGASYGPVSPNLKPLQDWLRQARVLEAVVHDAPALGVTGPLKVSAQNCGEVNAFYIPRTGIALCYELVEVMWRQHLAQVKETSLQVETVRFADALRFALMHELGHAAIELIADKRGFLGREETAADGFGAYVLLHSVPEAGVLDAVYGAQAIFYGVGVGAVHPSDSHETPAQRFANFACMAVIRAPQLQSILLQYNVLDSSRLSSCRREWAMAEKALQSIGN